MRRRATEALTTPQESKVTPTTWLLTITYHAVNRAQTHNSPSWFILALTSDIIPQINSLLTASSEWYKI
jgi:hypothetical protein